MSDANAEQGTGLRGRVEGFLRGLCTWAEVDGMTQDEALAVAEMGCALAGQGRLDEARVLFEGLVAGNPRDASAHAALGSVYHRLGRNADAREAYSAALSCERSHPVALANRGLLRLQEGDAEGWEDLHAAVRADPGGRTLAAQRARAMLDGLAHASESAWATLKT